MARPPADQHCMFCDPNPCECHTPKKKAAPKKRSKPSSSPSPVQAAESPPQSTEPPATAFDPRAAMKAAISDAKPFVERDGAVDSTASLETSGHHSDISSRRLRAQGFTELRNAHEAAQEAAGSDTVLTDEVARTLDSFERRAIFALGPLLADADRDAVPSIFNDPKLRAERWKRNRNDS